MVGLGLWHLPAGPSQEAIVAPELTSKANDLMVALGRLAAAQERSGGATDIEALFQTASQATSEMAGLLGSQELI
jgi:hypothetical protein